MSYASILESLSAPRPGERPQRPPRRQQPADFALSAPSQGPQGSDKPSDLRSESLASTASTSLAPPSLEENDSRGGMEGETQGVDIPRRERHSVSFSRETVSGPSQGGVFATGLDDAMHVFRKQLLEVFAGGLDEAVEREMALATRDNATLREKLGISEQERAHLQRSNEELSRAVAHKTECCERLAELVGLLKQERRDALMLSRLLQRWKRNAHLQASHLRYTGLIEGAQRNRILRSALGYWRLLTYRRRYSRVFEEANASVARAREERERQFSEERDRYIREIETLHAERGEYMLKEKGLKDQMKQAFLRGISALTDEATTALDRDTGPGSSEASLLQGTLQNVFGTIENTAKLAGSSVVPEITVARDDDIAAQERGRSALAQNLNYEDFLYTGSGRGQGRIQGQGGEQYTGLDGLDDDDAPVEVDARHSYYVDESPLNVNVIQHSLVPNQRRGQPIGAQHTDVVDPSLVKPGHIRPVRVSRPQSQMQSHTQSQQAYQTTPQDLPLSKRIRAMNSGPPRDNMTTAIHHENLTAIRGRVVVSKQ
ncbi:hypothetical protein GMRT_13137 [Giardia muris]|uniref:Centrosomal protein POC5 n=1 Tax=Giardia muris TaxID=5742 RepID=A0A4Z1T156_GIAMU|nr:hypothetical protein GMRT_13137 [Giardia muris]|eukprot:TNJ26657.1 hypothetical protein GMRT_13137 [Giardia muris]